MEKEASKHLHGYGRPPTLEEEAQLAMRSIDPEAMAGNIVELPPDDPALFREKTEQEIAEKIAAKAAKEGIKKAANG